MSARGGDAGLNGKEAMLVASWLADNAAALNIRTEAYKKTITEHERKMEGNEHKNLPRDDRVTRDATSDPAPSGFASLG